MTSKRPRHPIVVIGAGIAGLAAANELQEMGIPAVVLERFPKAGGRLNSRRGNGWLADHGCRYIEQGDEILTGLIRRLGLEDKRVSIQGGVHQLRADRRIVIPPHGGVDSRRLCLDVGFGAFTELLAESLDVRYNNPVGAIRWDNSQKVFWWEEGNVFWFEDVEGDPIRDEVTRKVVAASGVILATTATAAAVIARRSRTLEALLPTLASIEYDPVFVGLYRIPEVEPPFFALEGDEESRIAWLSFEDRKAPERSEPGTSLMVVHANPLWSDALFGQPDEEALGYLYEEARAVLPELPEMPLSQTYKRWNVGHLRGKPLGFPWDRGEERWPLNPPHAPFALAGDYLLGRRAEDAAKAGVLAARSVVAQLPRRRHFLGLELAAD